jgi:hypothetical protein
MSFLRSGKLRVLGIAWLGGRRVGTMAMLALVLSVHRTFAHGLCGFAGLGSVSRKTAPG